MRLNIDSTDSPLIRKVKHQKRFNGETRVYQAYYESDAINEGIEFKYWKDWHYTPMQEGLIWIESDDHIVIPVYGVAFVKCYIVLKSAFGQFLLPRYSFRDAKLIFLPDNKCGVEDDISQCSQAEKALKITVASFAAHGLTRNEILEALCSDPSSGKKNYKAKWVKKFFQTEECHRMIKDEVRRVLSNCGLTEEKVVQMMLDAYAKADKKGDVGNMIRATENFVDLYGLKDKPKETTTRTFELGTEVEDLDRLENVKERIKLTQKDEKDTV